MHRRRPQLRVVPQHPQPAGGGALPRRPGHPPGETRVLLLCCRAKCRRAAGGPVPVLHRAVIYARRDWRPWCVATQEAGWSPGARPCAAARATWWPWPGHAACLGLESPAWRHCGGAVARSCSLCSRLQAQQQQQQPCSWPAHSGSARHIWGAWGLNARGRPSASLHHRVQGGGGFGRGRGWARDEASVAVGGHHTAHMYAIPWPSRSEPDLKPSRAAHAPRHQVALRS